MKKFLSLHFKSNWFIYFIYLLISILLSSIIIINVTKIPNSKKIDIFIGANNEISNNLTNYINEKKPEKIKEVNISYYDYSSIYFGTYYASKAINSDMVILPIDKDVIDEESISINMARIDQNNFNNYFSYSFSYYEIDGYNYGIKIYDGNLKDGYLKNLFSEDDNNTYYLFFLDDSLHINLIDLIGLDNYALDIMKVINSYVI